MIIISQVEPIIEPILENEFWYLPTRASASARAASMMGLMESSSYRHSSNRGQIPPFEYNDRYLQFFGLPQFQPDEIQIKMDLENRQVSITGHHERSGEWEFESCEFIKRIIIPADVDMENMKCFIAENGLLQIEAPFNRTHHKQVRPVEKEIPIQFVNQPTTMDITSANERPKEEKFIKIQREEQNTSKLTGGRVIPIEYVGKQPVQEESFSSKQTEQLERSKRHKSPASMEKRTIIPPPDEVRQMIREVPIRMARRPIDQGILCPCCHGSGSRSSSANCGMDHHDYPQLVAYRQKDSTKKDYQPKNSSKTINQPDESITISGGDSLNQAIDELQKVATEISTKPSSSTIIEDVKMKDVEKIEK
ncbi:lethal(2)essential for life-like protein [Euroglyphus maynei]|uniref:Lethal(2)essential for life-like protein n=1 Tax=Euroglyphus maynei TaxID=6958 RepID=A0A1Y3BW72_EURMA|nr:lethal(2)essential for life-like protein [Euroglyphus maynei]